MVKQRDFYSLPKPFFVSTLFSAFVSKMISAKVQPVTSSQRVIHCKYLLSIYCENRNTTIYGTDYIQGNNLEYHVPKEFQTRPPYTYFEAFVLDEKIREVPFTTISHKMISGTKMWC